MGASQLGRVERNHAVAIEAWSEEMVKLHRRECPEGQCAGRGKIWWIVRHPETSPEIGNETARNFVVNRTQVCGELEKRMGKLLPWIPGEELSYRNRSEEERAQLLGREFRPAENREPSCDPSNPFPEAREEMPQKPAGRVCADQLRERLAHEREQMPQHRPARGRVGNGFGAAVDALSGRG